VIVVPSLWEHDGETKQLSRFVDEVNKMVLSPAFLVAAAQSYGALYAYSAMTGNFALMNAGSFAVTAYVVLNVAALIEKSNVLGNAEDRPIGLQVEDGSLQPKPFILGYEAAEAHLANPVQGKPKGIIPVRYTDRGELGDYELYLQVEPVSACSH
jgi:hypothetical protein